MSRNTSIGFTSFGLPSEPADGKVLIAADLADLEIVQDSLQVPAFTPGLDDNLTLAFTVEQGRS